MGAESYGTLRPVEDLQDRHEGEEHSKLVMEAMRALAEGQLERADRLRTAGRQMFVYVSAFFAVGQTVAFTGFANANVTGTEQVVLFGTGLLAAVALAVTGFRTLAADELRVSDDISPEDILREADRAIDDHEPVADRLTKLYLDAAKARLATLESRKTPLKDVTYGAVATVSLVLLEVIVAFVTRIP